MKKSILTLLVMIFLVLQYRLWASDSNVFDALRLERAIHSEKGGIAKLEKRNELLDRDVQALKIHPEALEDRARAELGMIKKDETFCLVVEPAR